MVDYEDEATIRRFLLSFRVLAVAAITFLMYNADDNAVHFRKATAFGEIKLPLIFFLIFGGIIFLEWKFETAFFAFEYIRCVIWGAMFLIIMSELDANSLAVCGVASLLLFIYLCGIVLVYKIIISVMKKASVNKVMGSDDEEDASL